ncbi:hypothetical protein HA388_26210, partial [Escherichia coli]|nr:hypothetical protein [Escherichia coli]
VMAKKVSLKAFKASLQDYITELRQTIEAECLGFDADPEASEARRAQVADVENGYSFFVETYFPHYVRHPSRSQLHDYLFSRLPAIVASSDAESDVIAAPRGE